MKLKWFNLILTTVMSITVLALLIYVGYAWYLNSSKAEATNINFETQDSTGDGYTVTIIGTNGKVISAELLPDEITMLSIELEDTSEKTLDITMTPNLSFKEVTYTDNTNKLISTIKTIVEDPTNQTQSITKITSAEEFMRYYLVDEYYEYSVNGNNIEKGDKLYNLTDNEKLEIFSSFYDKQTYSLINKIKYYVSDTLYTSDEYKTNLIDKIGGVNNIFTNLTEGLSFEMNITKQDALYKGKKYIYFYFDPTDEIFPYSLPSTDPNYNASLKDYCFYGQNPYFYQTINFEVLSTAK